MLDKLEQCNIYTLDPYYIYSKDDTLSKAIAEINNRKVNCKQKESDIYFSYRTNEKNELTFSVMGVCSVDGNKTYTCETLEMNDDNEIYHKKLELEINNKINAPVSNGVVENEDVISAV
ncbi:hypothetical protein B4907_13900, partial [Yersinia kristensenii]